MCTDDLNGIQIIFTEIKIKHNSKKYVALFVVYLKNTHSLSYIAVYAKKLYSFIHWHIS